MILNGRIWESRYGLVTSRRMILEVVPDKRSYILVMYWDVLVGKAWKTIKFDGVFCCRLFFKRLSRLGILMVLQSRKPTIFWRFFSSWENPGASGCSNYTEGGISALWMMPLGRSCS